MPAGKQSIEISRSGLGILSLCKKHGQAKVEAACERAVSYQAFSYRAVRNILEKGMEKGKRPPPPRAPVEHENLRGADYYREVAGAC
jgi:hypothetical protein